MNCLCMIQQTTVNVNLFLIYFGNLYFWMLTQYSKSETHFKRSKDHDNNI